MSKRKKEKTKSKYLFFKLVLFLCLIGILSKVIYNVLTPDINDTFRSIVAFNRIKLNVGSQLIMQRKTINALFGSYEKDYIIYKHEYIGYINDNDTLYSVSQPNISFSGDRIVSLSSPDYVSSSTLIDGRNQVVKLERESYYYLDKYKTINESDYYIYLRYSGDKQINLVKNSAGREDNDRKNYFEKDGLNYVKEGGKHYFQAYETGENIIEITLGKKGCNTYSILSEKVTDYPTIYLIYLFEMSLNL